MHYYSLHASAHTLCTFYLAVSICNVTAVDLKLNWFSSFDKNNPYYEHGWLILHTVSYLTEICIHPDTSKGVHESDRRVIFAMVLLGGHKTKRLNL